MSHVSLCPARPQIPRTGFLSKGVTFLFVLLAASTASFCSAAINNPGLLAGGAESRSRQGNVAGSIITGPFVVTWDGTSQAQDWYAVTLSAPTTINQVVFAHGKSFGDGGWFDASAGKPQVQVQTSQNDAWTTVGQLSTYPATTATDGAGLADGTAFTCQLSQSYVVWGVRVTGKPASGTNPQQAFSSCGGLAAYNTAGAQTVPGTYATWLAQPFTAGEIADASISGDAADPDGDGIPNLLEYKLGGDPKVSRPITGKLEPRTVNGAARVHYEINFKEGRDDVLLVPEVSTDLKTWSSTAPGLVQTITSNNDGTALLAVEYPTPATGGVFIRLKASRSGQTTADTAAPTAPVGLSSSNLSTTSFTLLWAASTDNVAVSGYDVYKNGVLLGSTSSLSYAVSGLAPATSYNMTVKAKDAAANVSAASTNLAVTTASDVTTSPNYKLYWSDEFDGTTLNTANWQAVQHGDVDNGELEFYTTRPQNVSVHDGSLWLTAIKETYTGTGPWMDGYKTSQFTSGKVQGQGKISFQYGKFQARLKMPNGKGTWPAFWMLGNNISDPSVSWPLCGEIDIMEHANVSPVYTSTLHTGNYNYMYGNNKLGALTLPADYNTAFHIYGVNWTPDKLEYTFDDQVFFTILKSQLGTTQGDWPLDQPFWLILNLAVGGAYGGDTTGGTFPYTMEVDWVRVYKLTN